MQTRGENETAVAVIRKKVPLCYCATSDVRISLNRNSCSFKSRVSGEEEGIA